MVGGFLLRSRRGKLLREQGVRVVFTQDAAPAGEGVFEQGAGLLVDFQLV
jgi:hypothetical protein